MKALFTIIIALWILCGPVWAKTLTYTIGSSYDDAVANASIAEPLIHNLVLAGGNYPWDIFLRWPVRIPKDATITSAYVKLKSSAGSPGDTVAYIKLLDGGSHTSFATNLWRQGVTGSVRWVIPSTVGDTVYRSPDIASLIRSFVSRSQYAYNDYLGLRLAFSSGPDKRFHAYESAAEKAWAQLEINYTGGDALIEMWMAEPHVRTHQYIYVQVANVDATDKLIVTLDGTEIYNRTFGVEHTDQFEVKVLADYTGLSAGSHSLVSTVKTSANVTKGTATKTWTKLHHGYPAVGIDQNNALCIRNSDRTGCDLFFPITAFIFDKERWYDCGPSYCNRFMDGVNSLNAEGWYQEHTIFTWKDYLNKAWTEQRDAYHSKPRWYVIGPARENPTIDQAINNRRNCSTPAGWDDCSYVNTTKTHPALLGWLWGDEPDLNGWTPKDMKRWLDATHQNDTEHPVFTQFYGYDWTTGFNMYPFSFLTNDSLFNGTKTLLSDVTGMDYYVYEFSKWSRAGVAVSLEDYVESIDRNLAWNYNLLPGIFFIEPQDEGNKSTKDYDPVRGYEACGTGRATNHPWTPDPTAAQLKNNIWLNVIHGSKGIHYFGPGLFCPTLPYEIDVLVSFKKAMQDLAPVVLQGRSSRGPRQTLKVKGITVPLEWGAASVTHNGRVDYTVKDYQGKTWIFAARVAKTSEGWPAGTIPKATATFSLSGFSGTKTLMVYGESRTVSMVNGSFSDSFNDYDVHIYSTEASQALTPLNNLKKIN